MSRESHVRDRIRNHLMAELEHVIDAVADSLSEDVSAEAAERAIAEAGDRLTAGAIGAFLRAHDIDAERVAIDGRVFYRVSVAEKNYGTCRGMVRIPRHVYRPLGVHNGRQVCPLELSVGMVDGEWTPHCAQLMAFLAQEVPERRSAEIASRTGAMPYSHPSYQRVSRTLGEAWEAERDRHETTVVEAFEVPAEAVSMSVAIDRVSLLMVEDDALAWRMAYCGAITLYDVDGEPLATWRYGRMPGEGAWVLREQMRYDVDRLLEVRPDLRLVGLSDGAAEMCSILAEDYPDALRAVDFYHLIEKLSPALRCYFRDDEGEVEDTLRRWKFWLLNGDGGIYRIWREMEAWVVRGRKVGGRKPIHEALTYVENHHEQMRYASLRADGMPIGSGSVESTCKQLVALRMKRSGQRWRAEGGQSILSLRSLALSDRWDAAMGAVLADFRRDVEVGAQAA